MSGRGRIPRASPALATQHCSFDAAATRPSWREPIERNGDMLLFAFGRSGAEKAEQPESELPPTWLNAEDNASGNSASTPLVCDDGPIPTLLTEETSIAQAEVLMAVARGPLMAHECASRWRTHGQEPPPALVEDGARARVGKIGAKLLNEISVGESYYAAERSPEGSDSSAQGPTKRGRRRMRLCAAPRSVQHSIPTSQVHRVRCSPARAASQLAIRACRVGEGAGASGCAQ